VLRRSRHAPADGQPFRLTGSMGEAYRVLRSNVAVALAEIEHPTIVITSSQAGEGKTSTAVHLAATFAAAGSRVVLIDVDLRHPDVHHWLGAHNEFGVSDVLLGRRSLEDCLQYVEISGSQTSRGLYALTTGPPVSEPAELLSTRRTSHLLEALVSQADVVLIDTPPVLPVADTLVVGRVASGALLVVETRKTAVGAVQQAKNALIRNQTRLLGVVMNKLQPRDQSVGFGYGYGYTAEEMAQPMTLSTDR
jgi:succinoglycan biosynthesis transport protein ExoP